jgi:hypothetical protein
LTFSSAKFIYFFLPVLTDRWRRGALLFDARSKILSVHSAMRTHNTHNSLDFEF